jgi:hypothetical protein
VPIVSLPGGEVRDEIRQPLYDAVDLINPDTLGAFGSEVFFQSLTDVNGNTKSLAKTNMTQLGNGAGALGTATSFLIQGMCWDAQNDAEANVEFIPTLVNRSSVSLVVGVKNYWQSPLRYAAGRITEYLMSGTGIAAGRAFQQAGWPAVQPIVLQGKHTIPVNPLQPFSVTWTVAAQDLTAAEAALTVAAGSDLQFVFSLKGLLRRPVQ